jgi:hypothetical protein
LASCSSKEAVTYSPSARDLFELDQVGAPRDGVLMQDFEMRLVPHTGAGEFSWPAAPSRAET